MDVPLSTSTVLATRDDELFSTDEQLALAGFLAGYSGPGTSSPIRRHQIWLDGCARQAEASVQRLPGLTVATLRVNRQRA
ncbi:MAG: hypothetical protein ACRDSF_18895 [Pseudonocardiaceae bacterium]